MKKLIFASALLVECAVMAADNAVVHARFGADAFNRAISAATRGNAVFSPYSFEVGCIALCDAFDPITKAHFAERIGVLSDLEEVYGAIMSRIGDAQTTNRFSVVTARAICLPDARMANVVYRRQLQLVYATEICPGIPANGAECWLRSAMDGDMEDFSIPDGTITSDTFAAYDLVSVRFSWLAPFPTENTRGVQFQLADGSKKTIEAMCDIRNADIWRNRRFSMIRLPLADGAWFYALLPAEGMTVGDIRNEFTSATVDDILAVMNSVTVSGVSHGPAVIVLPKMQIMSDLDLKGVFGYFKFPLRGFQRMPSDIAPAAVRQRVRFRLDEQGLDAEPLVSKQSDQVVRANADTQKFLLVRPFLFFVYHEPTGMIPVAGQFTGM